LDIANYRTVKLGLDSGTKFDLVSIQLGINDIGQTPSAVLSDATISGITNNLKAIVSAFTVDNPTGKVIVQLSPSCNSTGGGFGASSQFPLYMTNMFKLRNSLVTAFDSGAFNANVYIGYAGAFMHRFYGYPQATVNISSRYSGVTESYNTNSVHPRTEGYQELGDGIFPQIHKLLLP
jgi:lysophospholipase L1-like esterase